MSVGIPTHYPASQKSAFTGLKRVAISHWSVRIKSFLGWLVEQLCSRKNQVAGDFFLDVFVDALLTARIRSIRW